jgi:magnesium chelatase subunit D
VSEAPSAWDDAVRAAAVFAVDPAGTGGVVLRARAGPVRDRWAVLLAERLDDDTPIHRIPVNVTDDRLLGGLDLTATLHAGRPIAAKGLLAHADGGVLRIAMADRLAAGTASKIAGAIDTGEVAFARDGVAETHPARFGVLAFDEGDAPDEHPPEALTDRLALHIDLNPISHRQTESSGPRARAVQLARERLPYVHTPESIVEALCSTAASVGIGSLRVPYLALRVAQAHAALSGRDTVADADAAFAGRLVLTPRATQLPPAEAEESESEQSESEDDSPSEEEAVDSDTDHHGESGSGGENTQDQQDEQETQDAPIDPDTMAEVVLAAVQAALTPGQLDALRQGAHGKGGNIGRAGANNTAQDRGRQVGTRRGRPHAGAKLDVVATLQAAAPWQPLRGRTMGDGETKPGRVQVRPEDFRIARTKHKSETTTIFCVDASGSAALHRLAETKGAIELLLGDCYIRRDRVALVAFRGTGADTLLPPTRSLTQAKRSLSELPGGGGTPVASGIDAAMDIAEGALRRGDTPTIVVLTDGRANVARDGTGGRERALSDAQAAARRIRAAGVRAMLMDTSPRPRPAARELAAEMGARYLPLPQADAAALSRAVRESRDDRATERAA